MRNQSLFRSRCRPKASVVLWGLDDFSSENKLFELGIWHPSALPSDQQDRSGYKMLCGCSYVYPPWRSRAERRRALDSIQAFVEEVKTLIGALPAGESDFTGVYGFLHLQLYVSPGAGSRNFAIAELARQHGLACYDPQSDTLTLPLSLVSREQENPSETNLPAMAPDEKATTVVFGPWTVKSYTETTRRRYRSITESGSERCQCDNCENFAQARDQMYPPEVLAFFDSVGIDLRKESEVHYYGRTAAGLHTYRGWFYFSGVIEQGPDSWHYPPDGKPERRFHRIGPRFEVGLGRKVDYGYSEWETVLIDAGFADAPCAEVDFYVDMPWLSAAPEPDSPSD